MKRISILMLSVLMMFFCFAPKLQKTYAATITDNSIIILTGKVNEENELVIVANLSMNTGISGMTLELVYDKSAMTLTNVVLGTALSSLNPITTNTKTEEGYSITPFKFNYMGSENDFSGGKLFTLTFRLNENINDGIYRVSLKYVKNQDVYYVDNGVLKTKNIYIDSAEIEIKSNSVMNIKSVRYEEPTEKTNIWPIVIYISLAVIAVSGIVVAVVLLKGKRNWKRL